MTFLSPELGRFRPSRLEEDSVTVRRPSRYTWQHWGIQGARNVDSWWWNTRTNPHEMPVTMVKQWLVKTISTVEIFTSQVQHETMEKSKFWKIRAIFRGVSKIWSLMHCQFPCDMGRCQVMLLHTRNMMRKVSWLVDWTPTEIPYLSFRGPLQQVRNNGKWFLPCQKGDFLGVGMESSLLFAYPCSPKANACWYFFAGYPKDFPCFF